MLSQAEAATLRVIEHFAKLLKVTDSLEVIRNIV